MQSRTQASSVSLAVAALGIGFAAGVAATRIAFSNSNNSNDERERANAGAVVEGNDLTLLYGDNDTQNKALTTTTDAHKFLPKDIYGSLVQQTVICCVDLLLVRVNPRTGQKEALLVHRSSEPAKGLWWLPGGRLLKGETFFAAAVRKAKEETGITDHAKPIQVLGVWNTFFPRSSWDTAETKGTQTVNPIVLVEVKEGTTIDVKLDEQSSGHRWIGLDPKKNQNEDKYVMQALLRLRAWNPKYIDYS